MSARIARGSSAPRARKAQPKGKARKRSGPGLMEAIPFAPETVRRVSWWLFFGMLVALAIAVAVALRVPQRIGTAAGEAVGSAGFAVKRVEIKGLNRMERLPVYAVALDQESMAMPLVDLDWTRERLLQFGWVKEVRVSRRLPDTLVVDVVERQPAAVWQHNRRLALIDSEGVVLEASGGLTLASAREYAETGVDYLAVGVLTHSAPSLDIGLDVLGP